MEHESRHQCMIYEGPPSQKFPMLAAILKRKLSEGYRCMYLNCAPMVAGMRSYLAASGMDVALKTGEGRLVLSSEPMYSDGGFDVDLILSNLNAAVDLALKDGYKGLWSTGDITWEFGPKRDFSRLMEYEWGLEEIFRLRPEFSAICQYHRDTLTRQGIRHGLLAHSSVVVSDMVYRMNPYYLKSGATMEGRATDAELDQVVTALCQFGEGPTG